METHNRIRQFLAVLLIVGLLLGSAIAISAQGPGGGGIATPFDGNPATGLATGASRIIALSHPPDKFLTEVLWDGADNLVAEQNTDGRWSWPNKETGSPVSNIGGPTGEGLLGAYRLTQVQTHLDSAILAGEWMKTRTTLSTHDPLFLINLSGITGDPSYQEAAISIYFEPLENGTYIRSGVAYSTTTYIDLVRSVRSAYPQYLAWDFSATCIAATQLGTADAGLFCDAVREGLNALDPTDDYHTIALAGGIWALAEIGDTSFTTTAGAYHGYSLSDLANLLVSWQTSQGYLPYDPLTPTEDVQETAYFTLALNAMGSGYEDEVLAAVLWLMGQQGVDGKWEACTGCGNYTEVDGESTWACSLLAPSEVVVDDDWNGMVVGNSIASGTFGINRLPTIQDGVNGVTASTVNVGPGTYPEQVVVTNDDLHLIGSGADITTIQAPSVLVGDSNGSKNLVTISSANGVEITDFTLSALGIPGLNIGIYVRDGSTDAYIHDNVLENLGSGSQNVGILVGRAAHATTGTATIVNNTISGYGKGAVVVDNLGSTAVISGNITSGIGPTIALAQNGIQVSRRATATVVNNKVSAHVWTGSYGGTNDPVSDPDADGSTGILLYHSGAVTVTGNICDDNQFSLWSVGAPSVEIAGNTFTGTVASGYVYPVGIAVSDADQWTAGMGFSQTATVGSITSNTLASHAYALFVQDYTPGGETPDVRVGGVNCEEANTFRNNTYAGWLAMAEDLDARWNDWGVYSVPEIEGMIWHVEDNSSLGRVFFEPFCTPWGPPAEITITTPISGSQVCLNQETTVTVQLKDGEDNPVPGHWIGVYASSGSLESLGGLAMTNIPEGVQTALANVGATGTPVGYSCQTGSDGTCSVSWTPDELGEAWLLATAGEIFTEPIEVKVVICGTDVYLPIILKGDKPTPP